MTLFPEPLPTLARALLAACEEAHLRLATAESCTGGLIAACLTEIPGSSAVFDRGVVTYSNDAKTDLLGVPRSLIRTRGAVSAEVARAMAEGLLARCPADLVVAVTGIAGPGGGSPGRPVGLVHMAVVRRGRTLTPHYEVFPGDRTAVRLATAVAALALLAVQAREGGQP